MIFPPLVSVKTQIELSRLLEIEPCNNVSELNRFSLRLPSTRAFFGVVKYKCISYVVFCTSYLKKTIIFAYLILSVCDMKIFLCLFQKAEWCFSF